jgi:hypothetical protein
MITSRRDERMPRLHHGVSVAAATNQAYNPMNPNAQGHFEAEPYVDFAEDAVEKAKKARKNALGDADDWPLLWAAKLVLHNQPAE